MIMVSSISGGGGRGLWRMTIIPHFAYLYYREIYLFISVYFAIRVVADSGADIVIVTSLCIVVRIFAVLAVIVTEGASFYSLEKKYGITLGMVKRWNAA